jgi:hypothetical protein
MPLSIDKNLSAAQYIAILKSIERGTVTYTQWAQLTKPMVRTLPWCLLQNYPKGLAKAKKELAATDAEQAEADKCVEAENVFFDNEDEGWSGMKMQGAGFSPQYPLVRNLRTCRLLMLIMRIRASSGTTKQGVGSSLPYPHRSSLLRSLMRMTKSHHGPSPLSHPSAVKPNKSKKKS